MDKENQEYFLTMIIDRFEEKFAVLKDQAGQDFLWPIKNLPDDAKAGMTVRLNITTDKTASQEREQLAKTLLNEILKSHED